jgi:tyrosine-protein phosphatase YwqE
MFHFIFKKRERLALPYKREIHCHIIPGVDDGSRSLEASIFYLKSLASFGVEEVVFTPHRIDERFENNTAIIDPIFHQLQEAAEQERLSIKLDYSFEYRLDSGFLQLMQDGKFGAPSCSLRPLRGRYLLIENSFAHPFQEMDDLIYQLLDLGYYPVLAHPERYLYYAGHHGSFYKHLQEHQLEFQCNLLSFAGYYGDVAKKMVYWMLDQGYVNFLGSDLHNDEHVHRIAQFLQSKEYAQLRPRLVEMIGNDHME